MSFCIQNRILNRRPDIGKRMNVNLNKQNNSRTYRIMQPTMTAANTIVSSQFTLKTVSYVSVHDIAFVICLELAF